MKNRIIIGIFILPFIWSGRLVHAQINVNDSLALVTLYDSLDGSNWTNSTNWKSGNVASWSNVVVKNNRVTELYLSNNNLSGTIPTAFRKLDSLQHAYFSYNNLTDTLPDSLFLMSELVQLGLDHNQLSGTLSDDLGKFPKLQNLYLNHNQFSGIIPDNLGNLTTLRVLYLNNNGFQGTVPTYLSNLQNLEKLGLHYNALDSLTDAIGSLTAIASLNLSFNNFTGSIPDTIFSIPGLSELNLEGNQFTGVVTSKIGQATSLKSLNLAENQLMGMVPDEIGNLTLLEALDLSGNQLEVISDSLNKLTQLQLLDLEDNELENLPFMDSLKALLEMSVRLNSLQFDDILPIINLPDSGLVYAPQDSIYQSDTVRLNLGNPLNISCTTYGDGDSYQWYQGDSLLKNHSDSTLEIVGVTVANAGVYRCLVVNAEAPDLILQRYGINVEVNNNVGLSENVDSEIVIYPNPVHRILNLKFPGAATDFELLDVQGRTILREHLQGLNGNLSVDIIEHHMKPGVYFYVFRNNLGEKLGSGSISVR